MSARRCATALAFFVSLTATAALAAQPDATGTWSVQPSESPGHVRFDVRFVDPQSNDNEEHSEDVEAASVGLTQPMLDSNGHVTFGFSREAGSFACDGTMSSGKGGGTVAFTGNPEYRTKMRALGYDVTTRDQIAASLLDVTTQYVESIARAGYPNIPFSRLIAFRALRIDEAYVSSMRSLFSNGELSSNDLIALKALNVTRSYVEELRGMGFAIDSPRNAIALMALHVDAAYAKGIAAAGYPHLSAGELVQLRALKIDGAYIQRVKDHGFKNPSVQELVRLKAMNII